MVDNSLKIQNSMNKKEESLSVSDAMLLAKDALENVTVHIIGEVSELSNKAGYKAVYFTIKDDKASLPCMIWNNRYNSCNLELYIGALVELTGRFTLYAAKGRMNFDVFKISLAGEGELRLRVANLAKRLQAEGLFSRENKQPIPQYPTKIGLVTSPRGAAVHDVLRTLRRRFPLAEILLAGVPVEGVNAPLFLTEALNKTELAGAEVILLVRGGGSFEDLMPFNDEGLARAIAKCSIPIVTGIGHEPDTSIADMVADLRASTPTAAAESVSITIDQISAQLNVFGGMLHNALTNFLNTKAMQLQKIESSRVFSDPMRLFENDALMLDDLSLRLLTILPQKIALIKTRLNEMNFRISGSLKSATSRYFNEEKLLQQRFIFIGENILQRFINTLALTTSRLDDLSPIRTVARGYSIVRGADGAIVNTVDTVSINDALSINVADGIIDCKVEQTKKIDFSLQDF